VFFGNIEQPSGHLIMNTHYLMQFLVSLRDLFKKDHCRTDFIVGIKADCRKKRTNSFNERKRSVMVLI
jgi:hypothetical protein